MRSTKIISEGLPAKPYPLQSPASPSTTSDKQPSKAPVNLLKERPEASDFFTKIVYFFVLVTLISQLALILVFEI